MGDSEQQKKHSLISLLAGISGLRGVWVDVRKVIWQPFVLSLGLSMDRLGALESLSDLTRILLQPSIGKASDMHGRKKFVLVRDVLTLASTILFVFSFSWHPLLFGVVLVGISQAIFPIWDAVIAESTDASVYGYTYSIIGTVQLGSSLLASLAAGMLANYYGFKAVFLILLPFPILSFFLVLRKLPETRIKKTASGPGISQYFGALIGSLKPPRYMWGFYVAMCVDLFGFSLGFRILSGMLVKEFGYTPFMLGAMMAASTGAMAICQIQSGKLIDKYGSGKFLFLSQIFAGIFLSLILYSKSFTIVLAAHVLMGISASFWMPAEQSWIATNVDPEKRAQAISSYSTFRTLCSFSAPLIGGVLFESYGLNVPIYLNLFTAILDSFLILFLVKDRVYPTRKNGN